MENRCDVQMPGLSRDGRTQRCAIRVIKLIGKDFTLACHGSILVGTGRKLLASTAFRRVFSGGHCYTLIGVEVNNIIGVSNDYHHYFHMLQELVPRRRWIIE